MTNHHHSSKLSLILSVNPGNHKLPFKRVDGILYLSLYTFDPQAPVTSDRNHFLSRTIIPKRFFLICHGYCDIARMYFNTPSIFCISNQYVSITATRSAEKDLPEIIYVSGQRARFSISAATLFTFPALH